MNIKLLYLIIVFLFSFGAKSYSQQDDRWYYFAQGDDNKFYVDKETIDYDNYFNKYTVWVKIVFDIPVYDSYNDRYRVYELRKWVLNCKARTNSETEVYIYYDDNDNYHMSKSNSYTIPPESIAETLYNILCK